MATATVKPTKTYRFHLKVAGARPVDQDGINPGDALLWSGYWPHEVAWFEEAPLSHALRQMLGA